MGERQKLIFTLVHGTFAKGAPWVTGEQDSSRFRRRLTDALSDYQVEFDDGFSWGHDSPWRLLDNTVAARRKGGDALAGHLARGDNQGARRYVVAHSHGGNAALYALRDEAARKNVDGLICLATPFLFSENKPIRRDLLILSAILLVLYAFRELPLHWAVPLWIYTVFVSSVTLILLFSGLLPGSKAAAERIGEHCETRAFPSEGDLSGERGKPFIRVLRVRDDEVGKLMSFTYAVGRWVRAAWGWLNRIGGWLLGLYLMTVVAVRALADKLSWEFAWLDSATSAFDLVMTPALLLATAVLTAMVVLRFSFAFDSVRWLAGVDTWSEETPWESLDPIKVSLDPDARGWLRHTQIQGPSTAEIARLVRAANSNG